MSTAEATQGMSSGEGLELQPGPRWGSFEELRADGSSGLQRRLAEDHIGRLNVKGHEFVIMRTHTFNRLYGQAQEVGRLSRGLLLIRQAVQLVLHTDRAKVAVDHLHDLAYLLPDLNVEQAPQPGELYFAEDERADGGDEVMGVELDPRRVRRPQFGNAG